jgi:radical SAM superfamily enzyme YgiQ (UPF0313 family)
MRRVGFTHVNLSLVSSQARTLNRMHRPHPVARFEEIALAAWEAGMHTVAYLILGLPGENLEEMIQTLTILARLPVLIGASIFYLTPGSPIASDFPPMSPEEIFTARSTAMAVETDCFAREDLYTLFVTARIINFFKGMVLDRTTCTMREALGFAYEQGGRERLGAEILGRLGVEGRLYGAGRKKRFPLPNFRNALFKKVMSAVGKITTLEGKQIIWSEWK